jgi:hypothetical protein
MKLYHVVRKGDEAQTFGERDMIQRYTYTAYLVDFWIANRETVN